MKQRVITAAVLLLLLAVVVWQIYTPLFIIVIAAFSAIASNEIMKCAKIKNKFLLIFGTALGFIIPFFSSPDILEPVVKTDVWFAVTNVLPKMVWIILIVIVFFLSMLSDYENTKFEDVAITFVASVLVPTGFSIFGMLRDLVGYKNQFGVYLIFYGLICALGTDVGAQLGGMAFGKTKMSPKISPKKTVEGAVCGIIFCIILNAIALVLYNRFADVTVTKTQSTVLLAAVPFMSFISMMGDLTASVLKRNFDVKDFGKIFPGHGGVMDRFDSSLFTIPLTYCLALFIV